MNLDRFHATRSEAWTELETLLSRSGGKPESLPPDAVLRLGSLYRATAADLATARRQWPDDPIVQHLESLVVRARAHVYGAAGRGPGFTRFFAREYWVMVAARPVLLIAAAMFFFGPGVLTSAWAVNDPAAAAGVLPPQFRSAEGGPEDSDRGLAIEEQAAFSTLIFTNNIRVTFLSFAAGTAAAIGTALVLVYNGVVIGAVVGLGIATGRGPLVYELVVAHGVLELSCIVVAAAAGMRMGWALIEPGNRPRARAFVENAREGVLIVLGTAPWLVVAGLVEGFLTPTGLGAVAATAIGFGLGAIYWALVWRRGFAYRRAVTLARR